MDEPWISLSSLYYSPGIVHEMVDYPWTIRGLCKTMIGMKPEGK